MGLNEIFFHIMQLKGKDTFLLTGDFHYYITVQHLTFLGEYRRVSELLVSSKMAIILEVKLCLSNFSREIETKTN